MNVASQCTNPPPFWQRATLAIFLCLTISGPGKASGLPSVADGIALVQSGQYSEARDVFTKLAETGDPEAMYHLGAFHHSGAGGAPDLQTAVRWYSKASEAGNLEAKLALGSLFYKGKGVRKDLSRALTLFSEAANGGLLAAQYNLAMMHTAGLAHTEEYNADEDKPRAYKWFSVVLARLKIEQDRAAVQEGIDFLKKDMTPHEIARGEAMAREWLAAHPVEGLSR